MLLGTLRKVRFFRKSALSMSLKGKSLLLILESTRELSPLALSRLRSLSQSTSSVCGGDYRILGNDEKTNK